MFAEELVFVEEAAGGEGGGHVVFGGVYGSGLGLDFSDWGLVWCKCGEMEVGKGDRLGGGEGK